MEVDEVPIPSYPGSATFNDRVLEKIVEHKREHPDTFPFPDKLRLADIHLLVQMFSAIDPESSAVAEFARRCEAALDGDGLWSELSSAYRTRSFWELINKYQAQSQTSEPGGLTPSSSGLLSAFETNYRGNTHQLLIKVLNNYRKSKSGESVETSPYNWSMSVIQSSGMGKSRMVEEASKLLFTIPINIRETVKGETQTYPPADESFRDYFREYQMKTDIELQAEYAILLRVLFDKTAKLLDENSIFQGLSGKQLASQWAEYLGEGRTGYFVGQNKRAYLDAVVEESKSIVKRSPSATQGQLEHLLEKLQRSCEVLVKILSTDLPPHANACLVYLDEAHKLTEPREDPNEARQRNPYHNLGKVLCSLAEYPIFFLFLSTNSHLRKFAPSLHMHPSGRRFPGFYLFPPFTELPFDTFESHILEPLAKSRSLTLENLCKTDVIVAYGRSLWYAHHEQWLKKRGQHVLSVAMFKLVGTVKTREEFKSQLAALSIRIGMAFDMASQTSREMQSDLVESHMRVVYAIPESQEFMHSGAPSEPVLADAAAKYLNRSEGGGIAKIAPEILASAFRKGLLAKGERGEVCGRLLMTIAHDIALLLYLAEQAIALDKHQPNFHRPVPVLKFLQALFTKDHYEKILKAESVSRAPGVPLLEEAFKNAFVFFSHFALAGDSDMLCAPGLAAALLRGMALQAKDNQVSIDAVIPIHIGPTTTPISSTTTSAINLQFKNRKRPERCLVNRSITVPNVNTPVLSIVFEFGSTSSSVEITEESHRVTRNMAGKTHVDDHHYQIVTYGCGSDTFNAIPKEAEEQYSVILAATDIADDFPRSEDPECVAAMHNLKPFFNAGGVPDHWVK